MKPILIEEIIPTPGEFTLGKTGDRIHILRPISLEDRVWLSENKLSDRLNEIFETVDFDNILRIAFHQLEDKTPFAGSLEEETDADDIKVVKKYTPLMQLRRNIVSIQEQMAVMKALLKTIGISEPLLQQFQEEQKKSAESLVKPIGEKSSISSPPSTATP